MLQKLLNKRQWILSGLLVMIAVAGYINWQYTALPQEEESVPTAVVEETAVKPQSTQNNYFTNARVDRENVRSQSTDMYRQIAEDSAASADARKEAEIALTAIAKAKENEGIIEGILKAKGFEDAVVYITEDVSVVVKSEELLPAQVAQIRDAVIETAKVRADQIRVMNVE